MTQCIGITKKGNRCKKNAKYENYCVQHKLNHDNFNNEVIKNKYKCFGIIKTGEACTRNAINNTSYCSIHDENTDRINLEYLVSEKKKKFCTAICKNGRKCSHIATEENIYCKVHINYNSEDEINYNSWDILYNNKGDIDDQKFKDLKWENNNDIYNIHYEPQFQYEQNYKEWKREESLRIERERERERERKEQEWQEQFKKRWEETEKETKYQNERRNIVFKNILLNNKFLSLKPAIQKDILEAIPYFEVTVQNIDYNNIKSKYRKLVFQLHPDKGGDAEKFKILQKYKDAIDKLYE